MNVLSYKEKRPLRIAAALILALAMMVTAMPMTVIAQTITTASQAAETNEAPAQAIEAEEAPLAENAAFEEKAEAEENSYEAAAPEEQQETSEEIKTETTVTETSSETRKAQEKALPEKSGDNENSTYDWNDDDEIDGDTQYANIRYFILDERETGDNHGLLHEITRSYYNPKDLKQGYNDDGFYNNVLAWDNNYYTYYRGNKVKLSSNDAVDVAERFLGDREQNRGSAIQLNFVGMDGSELNYVRYSVCYAIGKSTGSDLNFFNDNDVYEKTKFFQCGNQYYGPTKGGPYIKSVAGDGTAVAQNSGKQVSKVKWSFNEAAEDYREYDGTPSIFVIFKRANGMNYGQDNELIISHKALSEADGAIYPETNVLNGNGARTITKCQVIRREEHEDDIITNVPFAAVEGTNDIRITENSLSSAVGSYTIDSTKSIRIELASEDDNIEDVFVQTAKANVTNPNVYRAVTDDDNSPKDINSVVWKKVEVEESGVTKTYYEADAFLVLSLLDSANDDNLNDSGKTVVETLYSNASSETFSVSCKYYDKDRTSTNSNEPAKVSPIPTVLPDKSASLPSNANGLFAAIYGTVSSYGNLGSALDEVSFFAAQGYAVQNFSLGMAPCPLGAHDAAYYQSVDNTYHTDCYGRHHGDTEYMKEYKDTAAFRKNGGKIDDEKWVTYYDASGNEIDENALYSGSVDIHRLSRVVLWGYNYPKNYTVNYFVPENSQFLDVTYDYTDSSNATKRVYFTSESTNENIIKRSYYYNQRLGEVYAKPEQEPNANDPRNTVPYHLKQWGINNINGIVDESVSGGTTEEAKVDAPESILNGDTSLVFDGWYVKKGSKYIKISSDKEYSDRVLSNMTLFAGYTDASNKPEEDCGFTITALESEDYYAGDVSRKALTTVMNAYGYPDGDTDLNDQKAAIIYIILDEGIHPSANNVLDLLTAAPDFKNKVRARLDDEYNNSGLVVISDVKNSQTNDELPQNGICYCYTIETTNPNNEDGTGDDISGTTPLLKLTNKNRAQFILDMSSNLIDEHCKYDNLLVLVAVEHRTNEGTEIVFSDNYINYYAGKEQ